MSAETPTIKDRIDAFCTAQAPLPDVPPEQEQAAIAAFLARGGRVEVLPPDPALSAPHQWRTPWTARSGSRE